MTEEFKLNSIHPGDCVAGMKQLPAGSIDLAFADPPFNIGYDYDVYNDSQEREAYLDWSKTWIAGVHSALKPDGTFWLAIGDEYAAELKLISQEVDFQCRSWVIWYYTFGVNCKSKFSRSHAHLFHFVKDLKANTFLADEIRIPSARQLVYADARANPLGRLPDDTWVLRPQDLQGRFTAEEDTWYFPRVAGTFKERAGFHGCQMPEQLLGRIIRSCSRPGEIVLDPFSGSATTLAVSKKLGRQFVGFELSPEYVERGTERLNKIACGDRLDGAPEPLISAKATPETPQAKAPKRKPAFRSQAATDERKAAGLALQKSLGSEAGELKRAQDVGEAAIVAAFEQTHAGYSVDRVVADPQLNVAFTTACQSLNLPGLPRDWNWSLFQVRKAGKLAHLTITERTEFSLSDCEPLFCAVEMAERQMWDAGLGPLDDILCDPALAMQFDNLAAKFAPGKTSLQYRWGALLLHDQLRAARSRQWIFKPITLPLPQLLDEVDWSTVSAAAGLYTITNAADGKTIFAGAATKLRATLEQQLTADLLPAWHAFAPQLSVSTLAAPVSFTDLLGYRLQLVQQLQPQLNLLQAVEVEAAEPTQPTPHSATKTRPTSSQHREKEAATFLFSLD